MQAPEDCPWTPCCEFMCPGLYRQLCAGCLRPSLQPQKLGLSRNSTVYSCPPGTSTLIQELLKQEVSPNQFFPESSYPLSIVAPLSGYQAHSPAPPFTTTLSTLRPHVHLLAPPQSHLLPASTQCLAWNRPTDTFYLTSIRRQERNMILIS